MASVKTCFKCNVSQPLTDFYRHPNMADGHLGKCKTCTKADSTERRRTNPAVQAYDRKRGKLPHRIANRKKQVTKWRKADPRRGRAQAKLQRAVKAGAVAPLPCWVCNSPHTVGHHADYDQPLCVVWLCQMHHKQLHAEV
jgi:hypothetical protein